MCYSVLSHSLSGLPFPSPGDLPDPGIEPASLAFPPLAGGFFTTEPAGSPVLFVSLNAEISVLCWKALSGLIKTFWGDRRSPEHPCEGPAERLPS